MSEATKEAPSKMSIIRDILATDATVSPKEIQEIMKTKHGMDVSTAMISNYKSQILMKGRPGGGKRKPKPAPKAVNRLPKASSNGVSTPAPKARTVVKGDDGIELDDLSAIKELKSKFGRDVFLRLVDVFCH